MNQESGTLDFDTGLGCLLEKLESGRVRRVMLVGATDSGKTWLCWRIAAWAWERGLRVGFLDFDLGQSTVGPPGCIGLQLPWEEGDDILFPTAMAFLGYVSPAWDVGSVVEKGGRLLSWAEGKGYDLLVVDTSGMVQGPLAGLLKRTKMRRLLPDLVVALEREGETRHIFRGLEEVQGKVLFIQPSKHASRRGREERAGYRACLLTRYFRDSRPLVLELDGLELRGTSPRVPAEISCLQEGQLLGLDAESGVTLAVARLEGLEENRLKVLTPFQGNPGLIREVAVGPSVLRPDGSLRIITASPGQGNKVYPVGPRLSPGGKGNLSGASGPPSSPPMDDPPGAH
jgi:polynucleotide 5'-hydroxyl-kinase GRC3/NOL9